MPTQPPQTIIAKFEERTVHNPKFTQYAFELSDPFRLNFLAGQYVSFLINQKGERRAYSICSKPGIDHGFEILVDVTPQGSGVQFLENLEFGQKVEALAPLGRFVVQQDPRESELVFIATGSGVAPFFSMITDLLQDKQDKRRMRLYWGLRHASDLCWFQDFELLMKTFDNFHFEPIISQPPQGWTLSRGRVTDLLFVGEYLPDAGFYVCGRSEMIKDVSSMLEKKNVSSDNIHVEKFY